MLISDIISSIESVAPRHWQEDFDNTGLQIGSTGEICTGVLLCVDITEPIIDEAVERGCNLIVTHHPVMFRGVKTIAGRNRVERVIVDAIRRGVTIYSCHTSIDNAPLHGVSWEMARRLGLEGITTLTAAEGQPGLGAAGDLPEPMAALDFVSHVKRTFGSRVARCSAPESAPAVIRRVALCGGAGAEFLPEAIASGADAYVTSDSKLNYFLDYAESILLVDIGHFESEECTKDIFYQIITEKFPNFAVYKSQNEKNPINYL